MFLTEDEIQYGNMRILPPVLTNVVSLLFTGVVAQN